MGEDGRKKLYARCRMVQMREHEVKAGKWYTVGMGDQQRQWRIRNGVERTMTMKWS